MHVYQTKINKGARGERCTITTRLGVLSSVLRARLGPHGATPRARDCRINPRAVPDARGVSCRHCLASERFFGPEGAGPGHQPLCSGPPPCPARAGALRPDGKPSAPLRTTIEHFTCERAPGRGPGPRRLRGASSGDAAGPVRRRPRSPCGPQTSPWRRRPRGLDRPGSPWEA